MKIIVKSKEGNSNLNLNIPMAVVIAGLRLGKPFIKKEHINKYNKGTNSKEIIKDSEDIKEMIDVLIKGLKYLKKNHKGLVLVDIDDHGEIVKIQI